MIQFLNQILYAGIHNGTIAKSGFKKESYKTSEILQRYQYFMRAAVRYCKISGPHSWSV